MRLSKSDYKLARDCAAKLYYKKKRYPSNKDDDPYLRLLAEGGFMIEKMARLIQDNPVELDFDPADAERSAQETKDLLAKHKNITLCEATFISGHKLARVDILRKKGNIIDLVEVKAKSWSSKDDREARAKGCLNLFRTKKGGIDSRWLEYLEDVTFQTLVVEELYPGYEVKPFLCMPDTSLTTGIEGLHEQFELQRLQDASGRHAKYEVKFTGNLQQLKSDHFLVEMPVTEEVEYLREIVRQEAARFIDNLHPVLKKINVPLSTACAKCEYRKTDEQGRSGFRECWGALAGPDPHVLDLYYAGDTGKNNDISVDRLIGEKKTSLFDIPDESFYKKDGGIGPRGERQKLQVDRSRDGKEWMDPALKKLLGEREYPLHFIDFETTTLAVPYHAGMKPYEPVAFQWSCHTIDTPGAKPRHSEWINTGDAFPNFAFADSLRKCIGLEGTVFRYAPHETTILIAILRQMGERGHDDPELKAWLKEMSAKDRILDMYWGMVMKYYYHPFMKGKNSIKKVVEAIWKINPRIRAAFPEYCPADGGELSGPYEVLPKLMINGCETVVADGTGAMRAYEAMMYGVERDDPAICGQWKQLLQHYCKLDTAAMVMLWMHWTGIGDATGRTVS